MMFLLQITDMGHVQYLINQIHLYQKVLIQELSDLANCEMGNIDVTFIKKRGFLK